MPTEKEETVGAKRKTRATSANGVNAASVPKKRVIEAEVVKKKIVNEPVCDINAKPTISDFSDGTSDIASDYVFVSSEEMKESKPSKPKAKVKNIKPIITAAATATVTAAITEATITATPTITAINSRPSTSLVATSSSAAEETTLLPSVTPVEKAASKPPRVRTPALFVDTKHGPETTSEGSNKEETVNTGGMSHPVKQSIGWVPKLLILLLGFVLSSLPFMFLCTYDTLALAALSGQSSLVKVMLKMGADVELRNTAGESLLMEACRLGNERAVRLFLESGSSTETVNKDGDTPLSVALRLDNFKIADLLVDSGANVEATNENGETLLLQSVRNARYLNTKYLIEVGAKLEVTSKAGETPLVMAFRTNQLKIGKLLLDSGAKVERAISGGETLLSRAVFYNNIEKVQLLLAAGADVETIGRDGVTKPLLQAAMNDNHDVVRMLLSKHTNTEAKNSVS
jgi:ankyrin repeat protein